MEHELALQDNEESRMMHEVWDDECLCRYSKDVLGCETDWLPLHYKLNVRFFFDWL